MKTRTYLMTCAAVAAATALGILFIPAVADLFETVLLVFLMTNAR